MERYKCVIATNEDIPDGLAVVGEDKVVPDHEEKGVQLVKVRFFHERDFAYGGARKVVVRLAVERTQRPRQVNKRADGQHHKKQRETTRRELLNRHGVNAVYEQVDEGPRRVEVVSAATVSESKKSAGLVRAAKERFCAPLRTEPGLRHAEGERHGYAGGS